MIVWTALFVPVTAVNTLRKSAETKKNFMFPLVYGHLWSILNIISTGIRLTISNHEFEVTLEHVYWRVLSLLRINKLH